MPRYWIGIDPGTKTGFAVWDSDKRQFVEMDTKSISAALLDALRYAANFGRDNVTIVMEDARKRVWLPREKDISEYRGKLMGAGSVKRDCSIWEEFCREEDIRLVLVPPRKGATKWDADYFKKVTGWDGRTSNHARDAALLVFGK